MLTFMVVLILTLVQTVEYNDFMLFQIVFLLPLIHAKKKKKKTPKLNKEKHERWRERRKLLNAKMKWHLFCTEFCHNVWAPFFQRL